MTKRDPDLTKFGPDATFSAVAMWLTESVDLIDDQFLSLPKVTQIRLVEKLTEAHPNIPGEYVAPRPQVGFATGSVHKYLSDHGARTKEQLEPYEQAWKTRYADLRRRCVIREDIHYQEALDLTIWQGGAAFGMLRHPGIDAGHAAPDYEVAEQYFVWTRRRNQYVGEHLEIRLWGLYLPDFIAAGGDAVREIQDSPAKLLASPDILPGRDTGYVALYQMNRPPNRVDFGRRTISAIYVGENEAARAATIRAEA